GAAYIQTICQFSQLFDTARKINSCHLDIKAYIWLLNETNDYTSSKKTMATNYIIRFATKPNEVNRYTNQQIRDDFLIENLFSSGDINLVYSHYDRMIVGGAQPKNTLKLETIDSLKSEHFLD